MNAQSELTTKTLIGMGIVTLIVLGYSFVEINGAIFHLDLGWEPHANYHLMNGLVWLLTMFAVTLVLLWRHVKRRDPWAWGLVTFIGIGVFGGAVVNDPLTDHGLVHGATAITSGRVAYWAGWLALVGWVSGMLLVLPHVRKEGGKRTT